MEILFIKKKLIYELVYFLFWGENHLSLKAVWKGLFSIKKTKYKRDLKIIGQNKLKSNV